MVSIGRSSRTVSTVASVSATTVPGRWPAQRRQRCEAASGPETLGRLLSRGHSATTAKLPSPTPRAHRLTSLAWRAKVATCEKKSTGQVVSCRPSRSFNWDMPITTAMPLVKPMMMVTGM